MYDSGSEETPTRRWTWALPCDGHPQVLSSLTRFRDLGVRSRVKVLPVVGNGMMPITVRTLAESH